LLPVTTILTPNSLEAHRLVHGTGGFDEAGEGDDRLQPTLADCAQQLLDLGCLHVLLTGTHANTERVINTLYRRGVGLVRSDAWDRLPGSYHGSGCTLASAIAAQLACGLPVDDAVAGCAGLHVAGAGGRLSARHGAVHSRSLLCQPSAACVAR
jgi:hydroxymethylpyrimidine/phosphomethylpyrimidine kinase